mmetsp:Transcript_7978/g.15218  ORF Transcript_7978/g.15218 Transcript_7978/m.15218 type:complete len:230 (-) Transcript_7978:361-1050(-)
MTMTTNVAIVRRSVTARRAMIQTRPRRKRRIVNHAADGEVDEIDQKAEMMMMTMTSPMMIGVSDVKRNESDARKRSAKRVVTAVKRKRVDGAARRPKRIATTAATVVVKRMQNNHRQLLRARSFSPNSKLEGKPWKSDRPVERNVLRRNVRHKLLPLPDTRPKTIRFTIPIYINPLLGERNNKHKNRQPSRHTKKTKRLCTKLKNYVNDELNANCKWKKWIASNVKKHA